MLSAAGDALVGAVGAWVGVLVAAWGLVGASSEGVGVAVFAPVGTMLLANVWQAWRQRAEPARPWLRASVSKSMPSAVVAPAGLDVDAVIGMARARFLHLQAAWDASDIGALRELTTPPMLEEIVQGLEARHSGPHRTEVVTLHAHLLGLEEVGSAWLASVEFSGLIRESSEGTAEPFRELWMLASAKGEAPAWRLARQQALF